MSEETIEEVPLIHYEGFIVSKSMILNQETVVTYDVDDVTCPACNARLIRTRRGDE